MKILIEYFHLITSPQAYELTNKLIANYCTEFPLSITQPQI